MILILKKGLERISANAEREKNRLDLETIEFHEKVYEGYQLIKSRFPDRFQTVNADRSREAVYEDVLERIITFLNK